MIAKVKEINAPFFKQKIKELNSFNEELNLKKTILKMKEIVPEFISNNSKYETLDFNTRKKKTKN